MYEAICMGTSKASCCVCSCSYTSGVHLLPEELLIYMFQNNQMSSVRKRTLFHVQGSYNRRLCKVSVDIRELKYVKP